MKYSLLRLLVCPACGSESLVLETTRTETHPITVGHFGKEGLEGSGELPPGVDLEARTQAEVMEGALHCPDCTATWPIRKGIPRMLHPGGDDGPASAHRWTTFDAAMPEWEESFLDYAQPLGPDDFLGKTVLDAGCGFGRHAFFAARYGAEVVALDASGDAVEACAQNTAGLARVHVIHGNLHHPPVRQQGFDLVYCFGVLHHIEVPEAVFSTLGNLLTPGGRIALWVYGPRQGATNAANNILRGITSGLEPDELHRVSQVIASGLRVFSHTPYRFLGKVPIARSLVSHLPVHDHHRWPYGVVGAEVYDRLRIPVKHLFTGESLERWLVDGGYADVQVTRRVGNSESFRATGIRR